MERRYTYTLLYLLSYGVTTQLLRAVHVLYTYCTVCVRVYCEGTSEYLQYEGTKVRTFVPSYESTFVPSYESTFVPSYESTKVESTFVQVPSKVLSSYESTKVQLHVLSYPRYEGTKVNHETARSARHSCSSSAVARSVRRADLDDFARAASDRVRPRPTAARSTSSHGRARRRAPRRSRAAREI